MILILLLLLALFFLSMGLLMTGSRTPLLLLRLGVAPNLTRNVESISIVARARRANSTLGMVWVQERIVCQLGWVISSNISLDDN